MLGYGDTDKPTDVSDYARKLICESLAEIVKAEDAGEVIVFGHDWVRLIRALACMFSRSHTDQHCQLNRGP